VLIRVVVQPRASRTEIVGMHGDPPRLKIRLAAPPVDGEANEELLDALKKKLQVARTQLTLVRGATSKTKDVLCVGRSIESVAQLLGLATKG